MRLLEGVGLAVKGMLSRVNHSASYATTLPASLAEIENPGERKISIMFEVYLGFVDPGISTWDNYWLDYCPIQQIL